MQPVHTAIRVLFVDPDEHQRRTWATRLKRYSSGYRVLEAGDAKSALSLVHSESVDCVILELDLPDRNGLSVLLELVDLPKRPKIAVVVLTDFALEGIFPLAIHNGAQFCLRKDRASITEFDLAIRKAIAAVGPAKNRAA